MEKKLQVLNANVDSVLNLPNVVGVGIGYKVKGDQILDEHAIVVLVTKKIAKARLAESSMVPSKIDSVITDVREVGEIHLLANTGKARPAQPGISIGHYKVTAGTFGTVVYDRQTGAPLILSNNHVLANASNGSDGRCSIGDAIYQPGVADGGKAADTIAHLYKFIPHNYSGGDNSVDVALAKPINDDLITDEILQIGKITGIAEVTVGMAIKKNGRTTGFTQGTIDTMHTTVKVNMGENRVAIFTDQFTSGGAMSKGGDSGSLILNNSNQAVGLLFAGSESTTISNPIRKVLTALDVDFVRSNGNLPQAAVITVDNVTNTGNYTLRIMISAANSAKSMVVYEDGIEFKVENLTSVATEQTKVYGIVNKAMGQYKYLCKLTNESGVTSSNSITVTVKNEVAGDEWLANKSYKAGDIVTYQLKKYKCLQQHEAQVGWNPVSVPALWQLQ